MSATTDVEYTLSFDDDTTQKVTIGPFASNNRQLAGIKQNVIDFNNNFGSDTAHLALSKYGALWNGIKRVRLITSDVTVYF